MIEWYRLPGRTALAVILMIAMSNSSVRLTAGNLIKLSISSFGDVSKDMYYYCIIILLLYYCIIVLYIIIVLLYYYCIIIYCDNYITLLTNTFFSPCLSLHNLQYLLNKQVIKTSIAYLNMLRTLTS